MQLENDIASKIIKYMLGKDYQVFTGPEECNIVYLEGISESWTLNPDAPNIFNDRRVVIKVLNGTPK